MLKKLREMLKSIKNISAKLMILGVHFSLYFDFLLKSQGGNLKLRKSIAKKIDLKNTLNQTIYFSSKS